MNVPCRKCSALHWLGERISTSSRNAPRFNICCRDGDVVLPAILDPPQSLQTLYESVNDPQATEFRRNIRRYNGALAFTSVRYQTDTRVNGFVPFQIQGELYHLQGPLESEEGVPPVYAQVWIHDQQYGNTVRCERDPQIDRAILLEITNDLESVNPYIGLYRTAREQLVAMASHTSPGYASLTTQLGLVMEPGADRRRENLPTTSEVAAIIPDVGRGTEPREFSVMLRAPQDGPSCQRVAITDPRYFPLHYVLLFPHGDPGWHPNMVLQSVSRQRERSRLSMRHYHAYRLFLRETEFNTLLRAERLFQQYVVDAFACIELNRLIYILNNQSQIRADLYQGLADFLAASDTTPGRRIILPSSFCGSERFMQQCFQDAMAVTGRFVKPKLFITMTANPNWEEIQRELLPGQKASDRPEVIVRVFRQKKEEMLREIFKVGIFGKCPARVWTIEYQKRGLPHLHLLVFLDDEQNFLDPDVIDNIVCAELPDPDEDPELTSIVRSVMVHGPCGDHNPRSPCMEMDSRTGQARCTKKYPRAFCEETTLGDDGYPIYRRRNQPTTAFEKTVAGRRVTIDNTWVVPYNPYLTRQYKAHINVEICTSIKVIKYLYKYIYKGSLFSFFPFIYIFLSANFFLFYLGSDRSTMRLDSTMDEVKTYLDGRYLSPAEAIWRILEFKMHEEFPPVTRLAVHMPGEQPVYFNDDATEEEIANRMGAASSTLVAFFDYNRAHDDGRRFLYSEFPSHYTYNRSAKKWRPRQKGEAIGRMYHSNPSHGERFYLRLLLTVRRGPTSFDDLRTVNGDMYPTFRGACAAMGLLEDDREWILTFEEASQFASGHSLRSLFVLALLFGTVGNPEELWAKFQHNLCDDLTHRNDFTRAIVRLERTEYAIGDSPEYDYGLFLISRLLEEQGSNPTQFGLPTFRIPWSRFLDQDPFTAPSIDPESAAELCHQLNPDQRLAFDRIIAAVLPDSQPGPPKHFFLQGAGGTGKTFLYRALYGHLSVAGKSVLCVASSGIAATLLPNGRTAHSQFKIPLDLDEFSTCSVTRQSYLGRLLSQVDLIIWDEVTMQNRFAFEAVHRLLCDLRRTEEDVLFGGVPVVLGGDFAQTLPVKPGAGRAATVAICLRRSFIWRQLQLLTLRQNMRLQGGGVNAQFATWLPTLSRDPLKVGPIQLPSYIRRVSNTAELCERVFPAVELGSATRDPDFFAMRAILAIRNDQLPSLNEMLMDQLLGESHTYYAAEQAYKEDGNTAEEVTREFLQGLQLQGLPPSILRLKVGAPVMLLRNIRPRDGLCNGTRLVITELRRHVIQARILTGDHKGSVHLIPRIDLSSVDSKLPWTVTRRQYPITPCFAITVNKSQGQSLGVVGVDLTISPFSHGQLNVCLSRCTDVDRLTVLLPEGIDTALNVNYEEVLEGL
jgi:hypothetical protein